jgi:uncharacterized delta-60 repeat protein
MAFLSWALLRHWFSRPAAGRPLQREAPRRLRLEALEERTLLNAGDLDPTFGNGGVVVTNFGAPFAGASTLAVQADGRILIAGQIFGQFGYQFGLARFNSDGSPDSSFGHGGLVTTAVGGSSGISSVAVLADGRIVVAGEAPVNGSQEFALARYDTDGSLDASFGTGGLVTTSFPGFSGSAATSMVVQADGRIVVAGTAYNSAQSLFALARYASDGSLDGSFGTNGLVTTAFSGFTGADAHSLALQADGRIVVAGLAARSDDSRQFAMARYDTDGSLDGSFGTVGLVTTSFPGFSNASATSLAVQADGRIVVAGFTGPIDTRIALARYTSDGTLDSSFGTAGLITTSFPSFQTASVYGVALQADGRIVVVGGVQVSINIDRFALARYNSDGSLDGSFGTAGRVTTSISSNSDAYGVALQADGRIVVAGTASTGPIPRPTSWFAVARYEGDPIVATHFDFSVPAEVTAGQPFDVTVTARDANGNVDNHYTGTVTLSSTDPLAGLLGSHTFVTADLGVFTFSGVPLFTAGPQSLFAGDGSRTGQADLVVDPGLAVALLLTGPDQATAGVSFVVTLTAYDAYGNVASGYRGSVSFVSTDPAAQLPVDYAFTSEDAGSHDFTITLNSPGPVRLTAIDTYALTLSFLDLTVS